MKSIVIKNFYEKREIHYNPSVRIMDLVSHITYVGCVNFIHKWRDLQLKVDSERQMFGKLFMAIFFYFRVFAKIC